MWIHGLDLACGLHLWHPCSRPWDDNVQPMEPLDLAKGARRLCLCQCRGRAARRTCAGVGSWKLRLHRHYFSPLPTPQLQYRLLPASGKLSQNWNASSCNHATPGRVRVVRGRSSDSNMGSSQPPGLSTAPLQLKSWAHTAAKALVGGPARKEGSGMGTIPSCLAPARMQANPSLLTWHQMRCLVPD